MNIRHYSLLLLLLLLTIAILNGCSSSGTNETAPSKNIYGNIALLDWDYSALPRGGALVTVDGTSFSATSDSKGDWSIFSIPGRTYSFTFSKAGFETIKRESVDITNGTDQFSRLTLARAPDALVILDAVLFSPNPPNPQLHQTFTLYGHYPTVQGQNIRIVLSYTPDINIHDTSTYFYYSDGFTGDQTSFGDSAAFTLTINQPQNNVFATRDTIYVSAFVTGVTQSYFESKTGKYYFIGFGPRSNTLVMAK